MSWAYEVLSRSRKRQAKAVAVNLVWEKHRFVLDRAPVIAESIRILKFHGFLVLLIVDYNYSHENLDWIGADDIVFVHHSLWRCYDWLVRKPVSKRNLAWNPAADKILFMTGKPDRPHRIRLLWKMYRSDLLKSTAWSFFGKGAPFDPLHKLIPEETVESLQDLMLQWENNLDNTKVYYRGDSMHGVPIPVDPDLFQQCLFRIISETDHEYNARWPYPWVTEKTWITVFNQVPWIMAGEPGTCAWLESRGLDTFQWALPQSYDDNVDVESRLDSIVYNAKTWLTKDFDLKRMNQGVMLNWHVACALAREIERTLQSTIARHRLDATIEDICPTDIWY
jgi:hypothetical protein